MGWSAHFACWTGEKVTGSGKVGKRKLRQVYLPELRREELGEGPASGGR